MGTTRLSLLERIERGDLARRSCFLCLEILSEILTLKSEYSNLPKPLTRGSRNGWRHGPSHQLQAEPLKDCCPPKTADRSLQSHWRQNVTKGTSAVRRMHQMNAPVGCGSTYPKSSIITAAPHHLFPIESSRGHHREASVSWQELSQRNRRADRSSAAGRSLSGRVWIYFLIKW